MGNENSVPESQKGILDAIKVGDFCAIASYIADDENLIRISDDTGRTLVWAASYYNQPGIVSLLLNHKAKLNQSGGKDFTTPLIVAAKKGFIDVVQLLCEQGAVLDVPDFHGTTAIAYSVENKQSEVAAYLLAKGSNLVAKNGDSVLDQNFGKGEILRLFDEYRPLLAENQSSGLLLAASKKDFSIVRGFMRAGISPNLRDENGKSVWFYVATSGDIKTAKRLSISNANSESYLNNSPLVEAIKLGNEEMVQLLLDCDLTDVKEVVGERQNTTLHIAASYGHAGIINLLAEKGVNVHARNLSNLSVWDLSKYRTRPIIKELMEKYPEDEIESARRTLSKMAEDKEWRKLTSNLTDLRRKELLIDFLPPPSGDGKGMLWWASYHGSLETVRFVLSLAKNFDVTSIIDGAGGNEFTTPLWNAAKLGHSEIVQLLHIYGANLNAKDIYGNTPLHICTKNAHWEVMTFLVTAGCDYESKNNAGHLAVDMAGWRIQTKNVLISIIKTVTIKKDQIKNRRRSADDTASSLFGIMNSLKRLELDSEEPKRVLKRRNSELVHLRELLIDVEEDVNTESNLRELVYEVKFSIEDEFEEAKIEKPIGDLKKYIEHVIKENVNSTPDEKDEDNNTEET